MDWELKQLECVIAFDNRTQTLRYRHTKSSHLTDFNQSHVWIFYSERRYICYLPAGRSVLGKTVPEVLSTDRGRRLRAVLKTEGTVFPNTHRPRPANNVFIFFFPRVLCKQFLCWIFTAAIFKPGVRVRLTFRKSEIIGIGIHNCLFLRSLFTFYVLCSKKKTAGKDAKAGKLVAAVRTRGPDGKIRTAGARAISQSDSRI